MRCGAFSSCLAVGRLYHNISGLRLTCFSYQVRNAAPASINAARYYASDAKASPTEVSSILEQRIRGVQEESGLAETGRVLSVGYVELKGSCIWNGPTGSFDVSMQSMHQSSPPSCMSASIQWNTWLTVTQ